MIVSTNHRVGKECVQLHRKLLINNTCCHENKQQDKLKYFLIDDGGIFYSKHVLNRINYILIISLPLGYWFVTVCVLYNHWLNMRKSWFQLSTVSFYSFIIFVYDNEWQLSTYQQDPTAHKKPNTSNYHTNHAKC